MADNTLSGHALKRLNRPQESISLGWLEDRSPLCAAVRDERPSRVVGKVALSPCEAGSRVR